MTTSCIFCRIASGEVATSYVFEDDSVIAFNDIHPQAPIHVLLVPRRHVNPLVDMADAPAGELGALLRAAASVAATLGIAENGYRLVVNVGEEAGQEIEHLHVHLLAGRRMPGLVG